MGRLTLRLGDEFIQTIRTGKHVHDAGEPLVVMPWPIYRNMVDRDLDAIYEYLSSIPHAHTPVETCPAPGL
jgi:hypothetical protein